MYGKKSIIILLLIPSQPEVFLLPTYLPTSEAVISGMMKVSSNLSLFVQKFFSSSKHWYSTPPPPHRPWSVLVNVFARDKKWSLNTSAVKVLGKFCLQEKCLVRVFRAFQAKQVLSVWMDTVFSKYVFFAYLTKYFTCLLCFLKSG